MIVEEKKTPSAVRSTGHSISLEGRETLNVTGVQDVVSSNDNLVVLETTMGRLTVKGAGLSISRLNVENGQLSLCGRVNVCEYQESKKGGKKGGLSSLFK